MPCYPTSLIKYTAYLAFNCKCTFWKKILCCFFLFLLNNFVSFSPSWPAQDPAPFCPIWASWLPTLKRCASNSLLRGALMVRLKCCLQGFETTWWVVQVMLAPCTDGVMEPSVPASGFGVGRAAGDVSAAAAPHSILQNALQTLSAAGSGLVPSLALPAPRAWGTMAMPVGFVSKPQALMEQLVSGREGLRSCPCPALRWDELCTGWL